MYATLSALSRDELTKIVAMRRARPLGSCSRAQARAREHLAKMDLKGWPEIAMANVNAIIRAGGCQIDTLSMATLMTATEELVLGLMAFGKLSPEEFQTLVEPVAHVALPWVSELKVDQPSYERIKEELEEALVAVPTIPPQFKVKPKDDKKVQHKAPGKAKAGKPKTIAGLDADRMRELLAKSEDADLAAILAEADAAAAGPVEPAIEPAPAEATVTVLSEPRTMEELEKLVDDAIERDDQPMLAKLVEELNALMEAGEPTLAPGPEPSEVPAVTPGHPSEQPESIPLRPDETAKGEAPVFEFVL
jgi:hypothetical protein